MMNALELRERLQYNPNTGRWTWLKSSRSGWIGRPAGSLDAKGYWVIKIDRQSYKASRLAYLYMNGEWPTEEMDHVDGKSWNDCWTNLRAASRTENVQNRRVRLDNTSGAIGVYWHEANKKWIAQVDKIYLGSFDDFDSAVKARDEATASLHGEFANLNHKAS